MSSLSWMIGNNAIIRFARIEILDQAIARILHSQTISAVAGSTLDNTVKPEIAVFSNEFRDSLTQFDGLVG